MTNTIIPYIEEEIKQLSAIELLEVVKRLNIDQIHLSRVLKKYYPIIFNELVERTSFLNDYYTNMNMGVPMPARLYCLENNIQEHPKCQNPECDNLVGWYAGCHSFRKYCCGSCSSSDPNWQKKVEHTMLEHHGVKHALQSSKIRRKALDTTLRVHGNEIYARTEEYKKRCREAWDNKSEDELKLIQEHHISSSRKLYGTDYVFQAEEIKEKCKQSMLKNHGKEHFSQTQEWRDRISSKWQSKTPEQINDINRRAKETKSEKYGDENFVNHEKSKETKKTKYGDENYNNRDKANKTTYDRFGVYNYAQSPEFHKKCHKPYTHPKYPDMEFATSWEFLVYDFLTEHNIPFEYQPAISIPYECEGTHHTYHPDFLVRDRIVEVKGDNFFRINKETGKEEMYLTWKGNLSDEEYEWRCKVMEAKHQCMIANNVVILRRENIINLEEVFFPTHNIVI